jgi:hypothetical protein
MSRRTVVGSIITVVSVLALTVFELRREGRRIGRCATDARVLSSVSGLAQQALYPDTDRFLNSYLRSDESEWQTALASAEHAARFSAQEATAFFLRGSCSAAREMYLAAEQQASLVKEPRGNWLSFESETTKAAAAFLTAKNRYELDRASLVSTDRDSDLTERQGAIMKVLADSTQRKKERQAEVERRVKEKEAAEKRTQDAATEQVARSQPWLLLDKKDSDKPIVMAECLKGSVPFVTKVTVTLGELKTLQESSNALPPRATQLTNLRRMRELLRETAGYVVPECAVHLKTLELEALEKTISAYSSLAEVGFSDETKAKKALAVAAWSALSTEFNRLSSSGR